MVLHRFFQLTFILIFTSGHYVGPCHVKVTQQQGPLYGRIDQSVSIFCQVNVSGCEDVNHNVFWYVFKSDSHYQLNTEIHRLQYLMASEELVINSLLHSDEGVYYCAAVKYSNTKTIGMQAFGKGTTLMIKDNHYSPGQILLFTLVVLLSLYCLLTVSLIICIKMGRATPFIPKRQSTKSQVKSESIKSVHFGAVVQELYSKRNLRRNKKPSPSDGFHESKLKSHTEKDDIYQNIEEN